ncbi:hypothetical protein [Thiomonas sp. X19]|uniref:hypothetical protein n=1 Tax=Thiomonas sp. X19 TaxID=1050370 RepID=UPI001E3664A2|nr:hypothetical protein [Thiomonas sp. X19]
MRGQLGQQDVGLLRREPGHAFGGLRLLDDRRHAVDPSPLVRVVQDFGQLGHVQVDGAGRRWLGRRRFLACGDGTLDGTPVHRTVAARGHDLPHALRVDVLERHALESALVGQPRQLELDVLDGAPMAELLQPGHDGSIPGYGRGLSKSLDPPEVTRNLGGIFLRLRSFCGASASLNALAIDGDVDVPSKALSTPIDTHGAFSCFFPLRYCVRTHSITSSSINV